MKTSTILIAILAIVAVYLLTLPYVIWGTLHAPVVLLENPALGRVVEGYCRPAGTLATICPPYSDFLESEFKRLGIDFTK